MTSFLDSIQGAVFGKKPEPSREAKSTPVAELGPVAQAPTPRTDREKFLHALKVDGAHRYPGVAGDLHDLKDLKQDLTLDGTIPVLVPVVIDSQPQLVFKAAGVTGMQGELKYHRVPLKLLPNFEQFQSDAFSKYSAMAPLKGFDMKGMIVAGGAVSRIVSNQSSCYGYPADADLFLVGLTEEQARDKITQLGHHLCAFAEKGITGIRSSQEQRYVQQFGTERCITFVVRVDRYTTYTIQVILRLYNTASEVIHGFDLGSSQCCYGGHTVTFTSMGKLAFERGVNVVDLSRRRASYETRLAKYLNQGFAIALPDFDVRSLTDEGKRNDKNAIKLPLIQFEIIERDSKTPDIIYVSKRATAKHYTHTGVRKTRIGDETKECKVFGVESKSADIDADGVLVEADSEGKKESDVDQPDPSGYQTGHIDYNNPSQIAVRNFIAARRATDARPIKTVALCGMTTFTKDSKLSNLPLYLGGELGLGHYLWDLCRHRRPKGRKLEMLLGEEAAAIVAGAAAVGRLEEAKAKDMMAKLVASVAARNIIIPVKFISVTRDTALLSDVIPVDAGLSHREWYGKCYREAHE